MSNEVMKMKIRVGENLIIHCLIGHGNKFGLRSKREKIKQKSKETKTIK